MVVESVDRLTLVKMALLAVMIMIYVIRIINSIV